MKPIMCCTCGNWSVFKDDKGLGMCKEHLYNTDYNHKCADWDDFENKKTQKAAELGYD